RPPVVAQVGRLPHAALRDRGPEAVRAGVVRVVADPSREVAVAVAGRRRVGGVAADERADAQRMPGAVGARNAVAVGKPRLLAQGRAPRAGGVGAEAAPRRFVHLVEVAGALRSRQVDAAMLVLAARERI